MTLGLTVIIKDDTELDGLKRLVKSCGKYVDEIYITGTNNPIKKVKKYCAQNGYHYSWFKWVGDFAKARNFNFSKNKCDYGVWFDCDDEVKEAKHLPELVDEMEESGVNIMSMMYNYDQDSAGRGLSDHSRPRIYKNDGKCYWEKSVHETLNRPDIVNGYTDKMYVHHHYKPENHAIKELRNYQILLEEYERDGDKTDPRTLHYLGESSRGLSAHRPGDEKVQLLEQAIHLYNEHIKRSGWNEETYFSYIGIAYSLSQLERQDQAINALLKATELRPDWDEAYWLLLMTYFDKEDYLKAIEFGEIALIKKQPETVLGVNKSLRAWIGIAHLVNSYILMDRVDDAVRLFNKTNDGSKQFKELGKIVQDAYEINDYVQKTIDTILYANKYDKRSVGKLVENLPDYIMNDVRIQELRINFAPIKVWGKKQVVILCGNSLEDWADPSIVKGIGGSETAVIYLGRELVKLGYDVTVYNRCGRLRGEYRGVKYRNYWEFNPRDTFEWLIVWRNPDVCSQVKARTLWLWNHDKIDDSDIKESIEYVDKFVFLSKWQREQCPLIPDSKCFITSNGIDVVSLPDIPKKDPNKIIYASSPDRGLETVLKRWKDIKKALPKAELYPFYGWDNFDKMRTDPKSLEWKASMVALLKQDGIHEFVRVGQKQLMEEFASSLVWFYPTSFWEINCITALQAQMLGTIPVTTDYAALNETVQFGVKIPGVKKVFELPQETEDKLVAELVKMMKNPIKTDKMIKWCRDNYSWEKITKNWVEEYENRRSDTSV